MGDEAAVLRRFTDRLCSELYDKDTGWTKAAQAVGINPGKLVFGSTAEVFWTGFLDKILLDEDKRTNFRAFLVENASELVGPYDACMRDLFQGIGIFERPDKTIGDKGAADIGSDEDRTLRHDLERKYCLINRDPWFIKLGTEYQEPAPGPVVYYFEAKESDQLHLIQTRLKRYGYPFPNINKIPNLCAREVTSKLLEFQQQGLTDPDIIKWVKTELGRPAPDQKQKIQKGVPLWHWCQVARDRWSDEMPDLLKLLVNGFHELARDLAAPEAVMLLTISSRSGGASGKSAFIEACEGLPAKCGPTVSFRPLKRPQDVPFDDVKDWVMNHVDAGTSTRVLEVLGQRYSRLHFLPFGLSNLMRRKTLTMQDLVTCLNKNRMSGAFARD